MSQHREEPTAGRRERLAEIDASLAARLATIRGNPRRRRVALAVAAIVGLPLAWLHWLGLVLAGALIGLTRPRLRGAIAIAAGFGAAVAIGTAIVALGGLGPAIELSRLSIVTIVTGAVLGGWGALLRGVV